MKDKDIAYVSPRKSGFGIGLALGKATINNKENTT